MLASLSHIYTHNSLPLYNRCDLEWADGEDEKEREKNGRCPLLLLKAGAEILDIYACPKREIFFPSKMVLLILALHGSV